MRLGRVDETLALLANGGEAVALCAPGDIDTLRAETAFSGAELVDAAEQSEVAAAVAALRHHRLLCARREGPFGRRHWADLVRDWTAAAVGHALDPSRF